jgi:hypothetical protein
MSKLICKAGERNIKYNTTFPYNTCLICPHGKPHDKNTSEFFNRTSPKRLDHAGDSWWSCEIYDAEKHSLSRNCVCTKYDFECIMKEIIKKEETKNDR